jgi:alpha-ribazole phosphatase
MEIHLIRHTTPDIEAGICYGQSDIPLKNSFEIEFESVLKNAPVNAEIIYTSPLKRCVALASFLGYSLHLPVKNDDRLKELNFGTWEMQFWNDIEQIALRKWMKDYENERCHQGESFRDLLDRVADFLNEIRPYNSIVCVTHAGVIKSANVILSGLSLADAMRLSVDYGSVTTLQTKN